MLAKPGMSTPTFLIVGAMRAGTTSLYQALRAHPDAYMSAVKETNFFAFENGRPDLPLDDIGVSTLARNSITSAASYLDLFTDAVGSKAIGEASPSYFFSPGAATRIRRSLPNARIVLLLRDPVDRAYSAYLRRAAVDAEPAAFLEAAENEHHGFQQGERFPHYPLLEGSTYARHLGRFQECFPKHQLWVRVFEEFWAKPDQGLAELHEFLGLEGESSSISHLNRSGIPRSPQFDRFLRGGTRVKGALKTRLPASVAAALVHLKQRIENWSMQEPSRLPAEIRSHLIRGYFSEDIAQVEQMLGRDLTSWRQ